jgi:hypothetical protein
MNFTCDKGCQPDYRQLLTTDPTTCGGCETRQMVCCTPTMSCIDVEVKAFADKFKECGPCHKEEDVFCYRIINNGPGCATQVVLKAFICPAPRKICVITKVPNPNFTFKNGIFTFTINQLKPCEVVDVTVIIKEHCEEKCPNRFFEHEEECCEKKEHHRVFETTAFVEAKEEDVCVCNNVDFASTGHHRESEN